MIVGAGVAVATFLSSFTAVPSEYRDLCADLSEPSRACLDQQSIGWRIFFSLDMLLPIVELSREHTIVQAGLDGLAYGWFALQRLLGWVLALFIVAGLTGLTR